jgi:hypothetical protein
MNGLEKMIPKTAVQRSVLKKMRNYHFVTQFASGAIVVVFENRYQEANVIDTDGHVYSLSRYLSMMDMRSYSPMEFKCAVSPTPA